MTLKSLQLWVFHTLHWSLLTLFHTWSFFIDICTSLLRQFSWLRFASARFSETMFRLNCYRWIPRRCFVQLMFPPTFLRFLRWGCYVRFNTRRLLLLSSSLSDSLTALNLQPVCFVVFFLGFFIRCEGNACFRFRSFGCRSTADVFFSFAFFKTQFPKHNVALKN